MSARQARDYLLTVRGLHHRAKQEPPPHMAQGLSAAPPRSTYALFMEPGVDYRGQARELRATAENLSGVQRDWLLETAPLRRTRRADQ